MDNLTPRQITPEVVQEQAPFNLIYMLGGVSASETREIYRVAEETKSNLFIGNNVLETWIQIALF